MFGVNCCPLLHISGGTDRHTHLETQLQHGESHKLVLNNKATLVEARGSMRDVAFAPSEFGLKLVG